MSPQGADTEAAEREKARRTAETRRVVTAFHSMQQNAEKPLTLESITAYYRSVMHPDVRYECMGKHPVGGVFVGVDEFIENFLTPAMKMLRDVEITLDEIICDGDRAVALFHNKSTGPTGLPYNNSYCTVYRVDDDGLIVDAVEYLDTELTHTAMFGMPDPCKDGHVCLSPADM
jgi:ketosteroid isomerase-like protein